jgi:pimeloyl-ACP methyl ester carboxylesterase
MTAGEEVLVDVGRGIELCYDQTGDPADPPILLIAGLGQQLHSWPTDFVAALAGRGFRVTRFDNRDAGRSTHMSYPPPNPVAMFRGGDRGRQYHLGDMARDTVGLLDALGYADAHLVGISMGGMIAQTIAAHHPGRVRTLTSIMSTIGAPRLGRPAWSTWRRMLTSRPPRTRAEAMDRAANMFSHIGSHGFPFDEQAVREYAGVAWDRDSSPAGIVRQLTGIFASGDRSAELRHIDVPTLVIHGDHDRMVHPTGGAATARAIPGARLETIVGLGHDLPIGAWGRIIDLITDHAASVGFAVHRAAPAIHNELEEHA